MHLCMDKPDLAAIDFDWNHARAFLVTAREGSFSAAARALGVAQPTVGRQIAALEEHLGVLLFDRVGGGLVLTPTGHDLVEHVGTMAEAAARVSLSAAGHADTIDGIIRISAGEIVSTYTLPRIIAHMRRAHPGLEVELIVTNQASDLRRREADIALRSFRPKDPELVARKVRDTQARLYASPAYLASIGDPTTPEALSQGEFIGFDRGPALMQGLNALGLSLTPDNFRVVTENQLVQWAMCRHGVGICIMTTDVADAEPAVRLALPDLPAIPVPSWLTTHRELHTSRRIRVAFDLIADALRDPTSLS